MFLRRRKGFLILLKRGETCALEAGQAPMLMKEWMHSNCNMSKAKTNEEIILLSATMGNCNGFGDMLPLPRGLSGLDLR
jgi:hypothetical protein